MNTTPTLIEAAESACNARTPKDLAYSLHILRAALEEAKSAPVFIFVSDAGITVTDERAQEFPRILHIDYNLLVVSDQCPICGEPVEYGLHPDLDGEVCGTCGFNWAAGGEDEDQRAIAAALNYEAVQKGSSR